MVKRCGFYVDGYHIVQRVVEIDWDLGFDKSAKQEYTRRIITALGDIPTPAVDVTTASVDPYAKRLSPIYVKMMEEDISVEDYWKRFKNNPKYVPICDYATLCYIYLTNLSEYEVSIAFKYNCYVDVFHNPDKGLDNTQAYWIAVLRLLIKSGMDVNEMSVLTFRNWYAEVLQFIEYQYV